MHICGGYRRGCDANGPRAQRRGAPPDEGWHVGGYCFIVDRVYTIGQLEFASISSLQYTVLICFQICPYVFVLTVLLHKTRCFRLYCADNSTVRIISLLQRSTRHAPPSVLVTGLVTSISKLLPWVVKKSKYPGLQMNGIVRYVA